MPESIQQAYRDRAVWYLEKWIGVPYVWGGDDFSAFDCSGVVVEVFKGIGIFKEGEDYTADGLYHLTKSGELDPPLGPYKGCLIFWFNPLTERAVHVAMMTDSYFLIHASGGGSGVLSVLDAIKKNAFVKMREFKKVAKFRKENYGQYCKITDPFNELVGWV